MMSRVAGLSGRVGREAAYRETMEKLLTETEQSLDAANKERNELYFENQQLRLHMDSAFPAAAAAHESVGALPPVKVAKEFYYGCVMRRRGANDVMHAGLLRAIRNDRMISQRLRNYAQSSTMSTPNA